MKQRIALFTALLCCATLPAFADEHQHSHQMTAQELGAVSFPISCNAASQQPFNTGVAWLHSFEYEQARGEFAKIAVADPKCAMAYWGQAMSLFHQLWEHPDADAVKLGAAMLDKAQKLKATPREQSYIAALANMFTSDDPKQYDDRVKKYSAAMDKVRQQDPQDHEAPIFYALSLLAQSDYKDPELKLQRSAIGLLNQQLHALPNHPGVTHYIIHATDNPQLAQQGLEAARAYAKIAPSSPHAVHMPSHIFARVGLWQESIQSNSQALAAADKMEAMHLHMAHHRVHSMDFLEYAYLQTGDDRKAKQQLDDLLKMPDSAIDAEYLDYFHARKMSFASTYALERRQWREALSLEPVAEATPLGKSITYWTRAVAAGHLKDATAAKAAVEQILALMEEVKKGPKAYVVPYMEPRRDEALAWQRHAEGNDAEAIRLLRTVADKQDKVGKGETDLPAREMLAEILLDGGKSSEALAEYETSLKTDPNRLNGLYGAAQAAEAAGKGAKAKDYYAQIMKNCNGSDSERPEVMRAGKMLASLTR
jgi:tetratricopeptide (TPR) repeat protein